MGLLNKLKNTFFEEEYVEVDEPVKEDKATKKANLKELKKAKKLKNKEEFDEEIEEEEIEEEPVSLIEEEVEEPVEEERNEFYSDRDLVNKNKKIDEFDDDDFEPTVQMPVMVEKPAVPEKKIYGESVYNIHKSINIDDLDKYSSTSHRAYGATENPFQPTPIISPIYGILDKNYRKEEVIDKKDKEAALDANLNSIRKKAYGQVETNTKVLTKLGQKEIIEEVEKVLEKGPAQEEPEYDPELDAKPVVGEVTVGEAEEYFDDLGLEYNVDYKDGQYETATGRRSDKHHEEVENSLEEVIINNTSDDNTSEDEDLTLEELINRNKEKELEDTANLEDNLFDLVDSMYGDGE